LAGGLGNDRYAVDAATDKVIEKADGGYDTVYSSVSYHLGKNLEDLILGGNAVNAAGNALANHIEGNGGDNRINGQAGADSMAGMGGNDVYIADNAGDTVTEKAGEGIDRVESSVGFVLSDCVETLLLTGDGNINGAGNSMLNTLTGNGGNNVLTGFDGDDLIFGKAGNDTLVGSSGADTLTGGAGSDRFVFAALAESTVASSGRDTITDFSQADLDLIDLSKIDANGADAGDGAFKLLTAFDGTHGALTVAAQGSQWLVSGDVNGDSIADFAILVTSATALVAADFVM
jgi:Ca2+-binding RTX toxin-like protein